MTVISHQELEGGSNSIMETAFFLETQSHNLYEQGSQTLERQQRRSEGLLTCGHTAAGSLLAVSFPEVHSPGCTLTWSSGLAVAVWEALDCNRYRSKNLCRPIPRVTRPVQNIDVLMV